jgi:hypothetical protein
VATLVQKLIKCVKGDHVDPKYVVELLVDQHAELVRRVLLSCPDPEARRSFSRFACAATQRLPEEDNGILVELAVEIARLSEWLPMTFDKSKQLAQLMSTLIRDDEDACRAVIERSNLLEQLGVFLTPHLANKDKQELLSLEKLKDLKTFEINRELGACDEQWEVWTEVMVSLLEVVSWDNTGKAGTIIIPPPVLTLYDWPPSVSGYYRGQPNPWDQIFKQLQRLYTAKEASIRPKSVRVKRIREKCNMIFGIVASWYVIHFCCWV